MSRAKTVTRQRRGCDLNPGPSAPEFSTLTTRLLSYPGLIDMPMELDWSLLGRGSVVAALTCLCAIVHS